MLCAADYHSDDYPFFLVLVLHRIPFIVNGPQNITLHIFDAILMFQKGRLTLCSISSYESISIYENSMEIFFRLTVTEIRWENFQIDSLSSCMYMFWMKIVFILTPSSSKSIFIRNSTIPYYIYKSYMQISEIMLRLALQCTVFRSPINLDNEWPNERTVGRQKQKQTNPLFILLLFTYTFYVYCIHI